MTPREPIPNLLLAESPKAWPFLENCLVLRKIAPFFSDNIFTDSFSTGKNSRNWTNRAQKPEDLFSENIFSCKVFLVAEFFLQTPKTYPKLVSRAHSCPFLRLNGLRARTQCSNENFFESSSRFSGNFNCPRLQAILFFSPRFQLPLSYLALKN